MCKGGGVAAETKPSRNHPSLVCRRLFECQRQRLIAGVSSSSGHVFNPSVTPGHGGGLVSSRCVLLETILCTMRNGVRQVRSGQPTRSQSIK